MTTKKMNWTLKKLVELETLTQRELNINIKISQVGVTTIQFCSHSNVNRKRNKPVCCRKLLPLAVRDPPPLNSFNQRRTRIKLPPIHCEYRTKLNGLQVVVNNQF